MEKIVNLKSRNQTVILPYSGLTEFDENGEAEVGDGEAELICIAVDDIKMICKDWKDNLVEDETDDGIESDFELLDLKDVKDEKKKIVEKVALSIASGNEKEEVFEGIERIESDVIELIQEAEVITSITIEEEKEKGKTELVEALNAKSINELRNFAKILSKENDIPESKWNKKGKSDLKKYLINAITG